MTLKSVNFADGGTTSPTFVIIYKTSTPISSATSAMGSSSKICYRILLLCMKFKQCQHCTQTFCRTEHDQHLIAVRSYQKCPFCEEVSQQPREHFQITHTAPGIAMNDSANPSSRSAINTNWENSPDYDRIYRHLYEYRRRKYLDKMKSRANFKEERVYCEGCRKDQSKSNIARCPSQYIHIDWMVIADILTRT